MVPYGEVHSTPEVMADISATPSSEKMTNLITDYSGDPVTLDDNLGLRPRARAVSGLRPCARAIFGSAPPIIQLALSIATSIFVVTVDFVHYFLTAARRLVVCARERFTAACALSAACVARAKTRVAFGSGVYCVFTILLTVTLAVAVSGPTPVPVPAEPLPDMISINGACHFALTSSSASAQPPGRPPGAPGRQPDGWFTTVLTGPLSSPAPRHGATQLHTSNSSHPAPAQARVPTMRTISCWGGVLRSSLPVAARSVAVSCPLPPSSCHRLRADADASCRTSPPGRRPWGGPGEGGAAPDLAAEAPAEAVTQEAEATAEATTQGGAEATAEAAAHKANQPAEASAQTEAEAPVTAAQTKAPAAAATRKPWWNLFRICYISAVAVSCTVEDQSLAFVFERDTSPRTAGALLASARDACAALDSERTCSAASAVAERSASASAARAVAVGCTVEQGVATVKCAASPRTAGALLASARDACAALDYDWARPAAASTVAELSASASAASAVAAAVTVEYSSLASVIESDNSHRTASASRARDACAALDYDWTRPRRLRRSRALGQRLCRQRHRRRPYRRARHRLRQARCRASHGRRSSRQCSRRLRQPRLQADVLCRLRRSRAIRQLLPRASPPSRATLECQLLPPRAAFGLARTGVAIYGTSPTPSASVLGGASEFGRLCHPPHTTHYTQCTSTAHPAPCPQCQYSSFLVLNLVTVLRPLRAFA